MRTARSESGSAKPGYHDVIPSLVVVIPGPDPSRRNPDGVRVARQAGMRMRADRPLERPPLTEEMEQDRPGRARGERRPECETG